MFNKKRAGGLPDKIVLAATPTKLYAFNLGFKGRDYRIKGEAAVWDRAGLRISTDRRSGMTALTIESPDEDEKATLVGIGVKDDPVSLEVIQTLESAHGAPA
jgi:Cu2+-containing amine oxidase